ncbi:PREDICTED: GRAM domain-containing protein 4 [Dipodomys ordii]|uniref:GRAM domain-containing protein 4 n=1 Tax=Dipodomys ordii TaxID=10020 RepID=A0A1S3FXS3_DIPOR|nr:PREDICTED: GRAM domain-containing protein 4 [Dipodomys ordii]
MLRRLDRIRFRGHKREDFLDLAESPNASDTEGGDELPLKVPRTSPRDSEELRDPAGPGTLIMATGVQDFNRTEFDRLNEIKGHLEIALLEKHFLRVKPGSRSCILAAEITPFSPLGLRDYGLRGSRLRAPGLRAPGYGMWGLGLRGLGLQALSWFWASGLWALELQAPGLQVPGCRLRAVGSGAAETPGSGLRVCRAPGCGAVGSGAAGSGAVGSRLWVPGCRLQDCGFWVLGCGFQAVGSGLQAPGLRVLGSGLWVPGCGFRAAGSRAVGSRLQAAGSGTVGCRLQAVSSRAAGSRLWAPGCGLQGCGFWALGLWAPGCGLQGCGLQAPGCGLQGCGLQAPGCGLQGCGLQAPGCGLQGCGLQGCGLQGCGLQASGCGLQGCRLQVSRLQAVGSRLRAPAVLSPFSVRASVRLDSHSDLCHWRLILDQRSQLAGVSERRGQGLSSRVHKWFWEKFGEYVEDFRFQPEESTVETEEPLSARRLTENMRRLKRGAKPVTNFVKNLSALSDWYSVYTSAIAFTVYMNAVWHGWAIPMFLFLAILRLSLNYLIARGWRIQWSIVPEVSEAVEAPKEDLTVSEKFQLVLDVAQKAQNLFGKMADILEKIKNLFMWVQPEITQKLYIALWAAFLASCCFPYRLVGLAVADAVPLLCCGYHGAGQPWPRPECAGAQAWPGASGWGGWGIVWPGPALEGALGAAPSHVDWKLLSWSGPAASVGREAPVPPPHPDMASCVSPDPDPRPGCRWQLQTASSRSCVSSAPAGLSKDEEVGRFHSTKKGNFHEIFNLTENERPLAVCENGWRCCLINRDRKMPTDYIRNGVLYVTENYLCFESSRSGSSKRNKVIKLVDITDIQKYKVLSVLPGSGMGIAVSTPSTQKPLVFGAMVHRDEAFETIFGQYMKITAAAASGGDS